MSAVPSTAGSNAFPPRESAPVILPASAELVPGGIDCGWPADWQALFSGDGAAVQGALRTLQREKPVAAIPALLGALALLPEEQAIEAAQVAATIGGPTTCAGLLDLARRAPRGEARQAAVYGLTWLLDPAAAACFSELLDDPSQPEPLRVQAAEGLMYLGGQSEPATELWDACAVRFIAGLRDRVRGVQYWSAIAAGSMQIAAAAPTLGELVRKLARESSLDDDLPGSLLEEATLALAAIEAAA